MGIKDPRKKYDMEDMVRGDCVFAATGVTTGSLLEGVRFREGLVETETVVMRAATGTVRWSPRRASAVGEVSLVVMGTFAGPTGARTLGIIAGAATRRRGRAFGFAGRAV